MHHNHQYDIGIGREQFMNSFVAISSIGKFLSTQLWKKKYVFSEHAKQSSKDEGLIKGSHQHYDLLDKCSFTAIGWTKKTFKDQEELV